MDTFIPTAEIAEWFAFLKEFYGMNDTTIHTDLLEKLRFFGYDSFVSFHQRSKEISCDFYCVATLLLELEPVRPVSEKYLPKPCFLSNHPEGLAAVVSCQDEGAFEAYMIELGHDWAEHEHYFNQTVLPELGYDSNWVYFPSWSDYLIQRTAYGCDFACIADELQRNLESVLYHEALDEEAETKTVAWLDYLSTDLGLTPEQIDLVFYEISFHWGRNDWYELVRDTVQTQCDFECMVNMFDIKTIVEPETTDEELDEWFDFLFYDMYLDTNVNAIGLQLCHFSNLIVPYSVIGGVQRVFVRPVPMGILRLGTLLAELPGPRVRFRLHDRPHAGPDRLVRLRTGTHFRLRREWAGETGAQLGLLPRRRNQRSRFKSA